MLTQIFRPIVAYLLLPVMLIACATTPRANQETEADRIRDLDRQLLQAMRARDAAAAASFYTEDAVVMGANEPMVTGQDRIRTWFTEFFKSPNPLFDFTPTTIKVADAGDMAYDIGTYTFGMDGPRGRIEDNGKYLSVWKKVNGEWKMVADMGSSNRPLAQLAAAYAGLEAGMTSSGMLGGAQVNASALEWKDAPPSLPPGAKLAVLEGNPAQPGPFTFRLKVPDNYRVPPHFHPVIEHVTVISGTFQLGMGEQWDDSKLKTLAAGDFSYMPPGMRHFARSRGETVIQLHSIGPWGLTYVNRQDDPRNRTTP